MTIIKIEPWPVRMLCERGAATPEEAIVIASILSLIRAQAQL
jgi:hypothetical protein